MLGLVLEAEPQKTATDRPLKGKLVNLGDFGMDDFVYLAIPEQEPVGGVLLIHEYWGLEDSVKEAADRMAESGYVTLAIDLFNGTVVDDPRRAEQLMKELRPEGAMKRIRAGVKFLKESPRFKVPHVATVGWGMGGGLSLQAALQVEGLEAAVVYYGPLELNREKLSKLKIPVLGIFANQDLWITPAMVNEFEKISVELKKPVQIQRYPVAHAFANPNNDHSNPETAAKAWKLTTDFLYRTFTNPPKKETLLEKLF